MIVREMLSQLVAVLGYCNRFLVVFHWLWLLYPPLTKFFALQCWFIPSAVQTSIFWERLPSGASKGPFIKTNEPHTPFFLKYECGECIIFIYW